MPGNSAVPCSIDHGALDENTRSSPHLVVILFYKYFSVESGSWFSLLDRYKDVYMPLLQRHQHTLCTSLGMRGRVLLAPEGINGTLSAPDEKTITAYIGTMERFDLAKEFGKMASLQVDSVEGDRSDVVRIRDSMLFAGVDWKMSEVDDHTASVRREPFPDLKVSIVSEIVSTGGALAVSEIPQHGGKHLSPLEFHEELVKGCWVGLGDNASREKGVGEKEVVLIDVRNTFEHAVGHFLDPKTGQAAIDPEMTSFASFDTNFCSRNAENLRDKKVLMYCTGGIRCEKASAMLRKRGVDDVSQLSGGIHRYLEVFGDKGFFKGKNFVFDQRVAIPPPSSGTHSKEVCGKQGSVGGEGNVCVGKCFECSVPYDEISGSRLCTVCRDLVLICPKCQMKLREYHCKRHTTWKDCYFTFLEVFDEAELKRQGKRLTEIRDGLDPPSEYRNMRRTLMRQITKVSKQVKRLENGESCVDRDALRRCRTCMETEDICDGLCWGFWKHSSVACDKAQYETLHSVREEGRDGSGSPPLSISVGNVVEPGAAWNETRHGPRTDDDGKRLRGRVVEVKSWGSGGDAKDCVAVLWDNFRSGSKSGSSFGASFQPKIYRWGVIARNGMSLYDVKCVNKE